MKREEMARRWESGEIIIPVSYVGSVAEVIRWRDKTTGKAQEAPVLKHMVIAGSGAIVVNERVPDTFDVVKYQSRHLKGAQVALHMTELSNMRGVLMARGTLEPLT